MALEPPPRSRREGFGFAIVAVTSTITHYALRDVASVLISSACLALIAEGRDSLCEQVGRGRIGEGYKEDRRTDDTI